MTEEQKRELAAAFAVGRHLQDLSGVAPTERELRMLVGHQTYGGFDVYLHSTAAQLREEFDAGVHEARLAAEDQGVACA